MVTLQTKLLVVAFAIGIVATGTTLAAGVTTTAGDGVVGVDREPLAIDDIRFNTVSDNGEAFTNTTFTTAEGADVFEIEVSNISGGNDFNVTLDLNNTADHSLYMIIEAPTSESIILNDVSVIGAGFDQSGAIVEVKDGVFVGEFEADSDNGFQTASLDFDYTVANSADANAVHEMDINLEFEERSPSQT
jgi:hypothetical protein